MEPIIVDQTSLIMDSELINYLMALWPKEKEKTIRKRQRVIYEDLISRLGYRLYGWIDSALYFELSLDYKPSKFVKSKDSWQIVFTPIPYCEAINDGTSVWSYDDQSGDEAFGTRVLEILGTTREAVLINIADVEQVTLPVLCNCGPAYFEEYVEKRTFWQLVGK